MAEVKVLRSWSSEFALRVVWALSIKGVEYETVYEDLTAKSLSLLEYNPVHKKVPVLVHDGNPICESLLILEYIDETWKQNQLLPQDSYEKAEARFWAKFGDEKLMQLFRGVLTSKGKEQDAAVVLAQENLKLIEKCLGGKRFFSGERIGYLDLAFGWIANVVTPLEIVSDVKVINVEEFPRLSAWVHAFSEIQKIKELMPPQDKLISRYQTMRNASFEARLK